MRKFKALCTETQEFIGEATTPELIGLLLDGAELNSVTVVITGGITFIAKVRKQPKKPEELFVQSAHMTRTFFRGQEPRQVQASSSPGTEFQPCEEIKLYVGQYQTVALLKPSGEIHVVLTAKWLESVRRRGVTIQSMLETVVADYSRVFFSQFLNC